MTPLRTEWLYHAGSLSTPRRITSPARYDLAMVGRLAIALALAGAVMALALRWAINSGC